MDSPLWVIMAPTSHHGEADGQHRSYLLVSCPDNRAAISKAPSGENRVVLLDFKSRRPLDGRMLRKGVATLPAGKIAARMESTKFPGDGTACCKGGGAADRKRSLPKRPAADRWPGGQRLTTRQIEILMVLKDGASNKEIARSLGILESTVKVHLKSIYRQLHVRNRTQAAIVSAQYESVRS